MSEDQIKKLSGYLSVIVPAMVSSLRAAAGLPPEMTCILNSKLCFDVLRGFGINAVPRAVLLVICNREFKAFMDQHGRWPTQGDVDDGIVDSKTWSIRTRSDGTKYEDGKWSGYLVVDVDNTWILDSTIAHFNRPDKGIVIPHEGPKVFRHKDHPSMQYASDDGGTVVMYEWCDDDELWQQSPDWTMAGDDGIYGTLRTKIFHHVQEQLSLPPKSKTKS